MRVSEQFPPREDWVDFAQVNQAALTGFLAVVMRLLPGGKLVRRREYVVRNPKRADRHPGSFSINVVNGHWADFASGDRGRDPISLVGYLEGVERIEVARLLGQLVGIRSGEKRRG